jgi:hypothetical protein
MTEEPNRCPECDAEAVRIYYGYVPQTEPGGEKPEIVKEQERGELVLGGCVVRSSSPAATCVSVSTGVSRLSDECSGVTEIPGSLISRRSSGTRSNWLMCRHVSHGPPKPGITQTGTGRSQKGPRRCQRGPRSAISIIRRSERERSIGRNRPCQRRRRPPTHNPSNVGSNPVFSDRRIMLEKEAPSARRSTIGRQRLPVPKN